DGPDLNALRSDHGDRNRPAAAGTASTAASTAVALRRTTGATTEPALRERLDEGDHRALAGGRLRADCAFSTRGTLDRTRDLLDPGDDADHPLATFRCSACPLLHGTLLSDLALVSRPSRPERQRQAEPPAEPQARELSAQQHEHGQHEHHDRPP